MEFTLSLEFNFSSQLENVHISYTLQKKQTHMKFHIHAGLLFFFRTKIEPELFIFVKSELFFSWL